MNFRNWMYGLALAAVVGIGIQATAPARADEATTESVRLKVEGKSCIACTSSSRTLMKISRSIRKMEGVQKVKMDFAKNEVVAIYDPEAVTSTELGIKLTELGFKATRYPQLGSRTQVASK